MGRQQAVKEFSDLIDLTTRVHNWARRPFAACTPEGHLINENTIVRMAEAAKHVRSAFGEPDWYAEVGTDSIYFVVLCVYRDCIIHNGGRMTDAFAEGKLVARRPEYEMLCRSMEVPVPGEGDELRLDAQPVIETLLGGLQRFIGSL